MAGKYEGNCDCSSWRVRQLRWLSLLELPGIFYSLNPVPSLKKKLFFFLWFSTFCIQQIYWFVYKNCSHWKKKSWHLLKLVFKIWTWSKQIEKKKEYHFQNITLFLFDFEYVTFENQLQISHLHEFLIMSMNYGMTIYW